MRILVIAVVTILLFGTSCGAADILSPSKDAADLAAAKAAIAAKDWNKADSLVNGFAAAHPDDPATPHLLRGAALQAQGNSQKALDEIEAGLDPDNSPADAAWLIGILDSIHSSNPEAGLDMLLGLGNCYRMATDFAKGAKFYEAVLAQPGVPADKAKAARRWLLACDIRSLNWARVEKEIEQTTAESPESAPWAYFALGRYYQVAGRYGEAVAAFDRVMLPGKALPEKLDPKRVGTAFLDSCISAEQWDKATDVAKRLAALYPKDTGYQHECMGAIYQGQKKYPEAIAELKLAIEPGILSLSKDAVRARKRLAECYRDSLPPAASAPLIEEMVNKHPKDGPYLPTTAGQLYQDLKEYDKAIALFKFVIEKFPKSRWQVWDACVCLGECMFAQSLEKGEEALAYIKSIYAQRPQYPMDYAIARGRTLMEAAYKPAEAAEVFAAAIAKYPQDPLVHSVRLKLVSAYRQAKEVDKAIAVLETVAAQAKPKDQPAIKASIAGIHFDNRKYNEAADTYRVLMKMADAPRDLRARAEYQLGLCYHYSNMDNAARRAMQDVTERYASSEWAKKARGMLYVWDNNGK